MTSKGLSCVPLAQGGPFVFSASKREITSCNAPAAFVTHLH